MTSQGSVAQGSLDATLNHLTDQSAALSSVYSLLDASCVMAGSYKTCSFSCCHEISCTNTYQAKLLIMHCRSEARKMEQKDLVMEGGVIGVGINLVYRC